LMNFYPMESFPQPTIARRPSTSLGFNEFAKKDPDFSSLQKGFGRTWDVIPSAKEPLPHFQHIRIPVSSSTDQAGSAHIIKPTLLPYGQGPAVPNSDAQDTLLEQAPSQIAPPLSFSLENATVDFQDYRLDNARNSQAADYGNSTFLDTIGFGDYMNYFLNNDTDVLNSWDFQTGAIFSSSSSTHENATPLNLSYP